VLLLRSASLKTIFVDRAENILLLLKLVDEVPTLKRIVLTRKLADDKEAEIRKKAKEVGIEVMTYNQLRVGLAARPSCPFAKADTLV
jgi:hypothetical protein